MSAALLLCYEPEHKGKVWPMTVYALVVIWVISGIIAWRIAIKSGGRGPLWAVVGQLLGPLSIPLAMVAKWGRSPDLSGS